MSVVVLREGGDPPHFCDLPPSRVDMVVVCTQCSSVWQGVRLPLLQRIFIAPIADGAEFSDWRKLTPEEAEPWRERLAAEADRQNPSAPPSPPA